MTFHVERISDEDKKKYEINMTGSWAIDPQTGTVFFYKRGFASGHIKVYDLVHDGVKVRVSTAPKRYSPDERIYNGTFTIQRILFPETHKDRLPLYMDLISSALKKLGFLSNPDKVGDIEVLWPDRVEYCPVDEVKQQLGV